MSILNKTSFTFVLFFNNVEVESVQQWAEKYASENFNEGEKCFTPASEVAALATREHFFPTAYQLPSERVSVTNSNPSFSPADIDGLLAVKTVQAGN